ncbi:putative cAMP-dependent protein kinase pathway protein (Som1) [Aspergillus candidus]|uniref:Uncharacterized protein n=1 Tax=Aspergillus candidus TaxID=41067 RepID=A0A2I2FAS1_ASPCN|nr:hypothetical protein BDW47DRAFT_117895 [Aspergillus candidus]PLB37720.1 hypothetical protein BDW47DRAFT_117895 [Aspergillus candidus]
MIVNLNTYIYDYFLKRGYHDCARALVKDESIKLNTEPPIKTSPGHRRDADANGIEGDGMMTDGKDGEKIKVPDDLPRPNLASESQQSAFLLDWFSLFWDFFWAQRKKGNSNDVKNYLQHTQNIMRMREQQHNQFLRQPQMMPGQMGQLNVRRNGVVPNLQKTVLQNNQSGLSQQQMVNLQKNQQQVQMMHQMQREQSDMDMNGHRPQSPASTDNAPSPSKRPRLESGHMNGQQLAPNGRGQAQGMPGQPNPQALLMQNGALNPRMNPAQFQQAFQQSGPAAQQKSIQVYAQNLALHHSRSAMNNQAMPNGMMNPGVMANQTDLVPMADNQGMYMNGGEYYPNGQMNQVRAGMPTPGSQPWNHALQDYQMQLMLLEQQNKRRLMMARQEQDSMARPDGQPMPGQQQGLPPGTSPQGSRAGASPNPSEQMKRATPKIPQTGLPGSPSTADPMAQGRGSPASMNFNPGQMPPDMAGGPSFFMKGMPDGMVGPNGMRPPSSNPSFSGPQMGQPISAGAGARVPSWQPQQGGPQGQPMAPHQSPATQSQTTGTPQDRNPMPPPQAPPAAGANAGRAQPPSPQTGAAAPPTPQQATKPAQKGKKGKDDTTRKRPKKQAAAAANANTAATPSSEAEHPPTPTPPTPITPQHPNSFNKTGANATTAAAPQPTSAPAPQPLVQQPPLDQNPQQPFNDINMTDSSAFNLDFSALENPDILENFDFDTFLNTDADTAGFGFDPSISYSTEGVETGTGEGL